MHVHWWRKLGGVECDLCLQLMCCPHLFLIIRQCVSSDFNAWNHSPQGVGYHLYICFVHPRCARAHVSEQVLSIKSNLICPKKARSLLTYIVSSAPKATLERTDPWSCFAIPGPPWVLLPALPPALLSRGCWVSSACIFHQDGICYCQSSNSVGHSLV